MVYQQSQKKTKKQKGNANGKNLPKKTNQTQNTVKRYKVHYDDFIVNLTP